MDNRNRITTANRRIGLTSTSLPIELQVDFTYDALDRRIIKKVAGVNELFAYDGDNLALKFNDAGTLTHRYLFGDAVDEVLADEDLTAAGGKVFWQMADHQGSVRRIVDGANGTARTLRYSAFGEMTDVTTLDEQFSYTGREFDEEIGPNGLYYYRGRYYDAKTGRFLSQDPSGFSGGDVNLYRYVNNSTVPTQRR